MWLPTSTLLMTAMMTGIAVTLSSNHWFMMWMGLELNMFAFLPLIAKSNSKKETSMSSLYLAIQASASSLILVSAAMSMTSMDLWANTLFQLAILTKAGGAPAFCWYPNMLSNLSWLSTWLLMTLQKIAPLMILSTTSKPNSLTTLLASSMVLIGGIGGMIQTQLRPLLAYSSITHLGWMVVMAPISSITTIMYFLMYLLITTAIILILMPMNLKSHANTPPLPNPHKATIAILLLSLAGIPPLLGFLPKLQVIQALISSNSLLITSILLVGSLMNLYFYLNLLFSTLMSFSPSSSISTPPYLPILSSTTILATLTLIVFTPTLHQLL